MVLEVFPSLAAPGIPALAAKALGKKKEEPQVNPQLSHGAKGAAGRDLMRFFGKAAANGTSGPATQTTLAFDFPLLTEAPGAPVSLNKHLFGGF